MAAAGFCDAREIGHGGFGTVFRCEQAALGRVVAVKVLSATLDHDNFERFRREEFAMGRLSGHPNIATIFQTGSLTGGRPYIVMPFADRIVVAYALEALSWIAARRHDFENATQLAGAAAAGWTSGRAAMAGALNSERRRMEALARSALGDERTAELNADGRSIGPDRMVAVALAGQTVR